MPFYNQIFDQLSRHDLPALLFSSDKARAYRTRFARSNLNFTQKYVGSPMQELGGRRYSDEERDRIREDIKRLALTGFE